MRWHSLGLGIHNSARRFAAPLFLLGSLSVRPTRGRLLVGYAAIVSTLPYFVLKILWLSGSTVGVTDLEFARDPSIYALNLFTALMDLVAIGLALTFTHSWGLRAPAWLIVFPIWVGTGFLAPIVIDTPIAATLTFLDGASESSTELPLETWVVPVVYASFVALGVLLLTAFVLYSRVRWQALFVTTIAQQLGSRRLALVGTGLAFIAAGVQVARMFDDAVQAAAVTVFAVHALMAILAVLGTWWSRLGLTGRPWIPVVLAWTGSGAMFSWGFWSLLNSLGQTALYDGALNAVDLIGGIAQFGGGLLLALVLLFNIRLTTLTP